MNVNDFEPVEYQSADGTIRARKDGLLWHGETLDEDGHWVARIRWCTSHFAAISVTLVLLGLSEPDDYQTGRDPDAPF